MSFRTGTAAGTAVIDVILPAYNGAGVIRSALESALAQDVPLRIIVVDDGSSDDSAAIARSYGPRVTVISQANQGVSGARNTGLAAAQAPYVALLDQDDIWQPGKLARQLDLIGAHSDVGSVFTDMRLLKTRRYRRRGRFPADDAAIRELSIGSPSATTLICLPESLGQAVVRFNFISPSTTLLRRQALLEIGGFDPAFRLCDDADCWMRLLRRFRGISIEESLVLSLVWEGNASLKWDKLILERIRIGEKATAYPQLFPAGTADYFRRERPVSFHQLGILALRGNDTRLARDYFAKSLRDRRRLSTALAFGAAMLPAPVRNGLLRLKRATGVRWSTRVE